MLFLSFRIDFMILLITFKVPYGLTPSYIAELLLPYEPEIRASDPKARLYWPFLRGSGLKVTRLLQSALDLPVRP